MARAVQLHLRMLDRVEIIPASDFSKRNLFVPARFQLRFPRAWRPDCVANRYAAALERETIAWLRSYGIGCTPEEAEKLAKFN